MNWKHLFYAALAAVLPLMYSNLIGSMPAFPLASAQFTSLVLWVIGLVIGGWQISKHIYVNTQKLKIPTKAGLVTRNSAAIDWKPLLKAILAILIPVVYNAILGWNATFPLPQSDFVNLMLWVIGLPIGGWQIAKAVYVGQYRL